jgi:hypothetical protein
MLYELSEDRGGVPHELSPLCQLTLAVNGWGLLSMLTEEKRRYEHR